MEASGVCEAREDVIRMATPEMEAAEALAGLCGDGRRSAPTGCVPQDQAIAVQQCRGTTSSMVKCALVTEETIRIRTGQLCGTIKSTSKVRQAEREARRLQRVLANRESARQTIRRRQAMHLELTRKVASLTEENKILKKEKERAVKDYGSLKGTNEFFKLQMANKRNVEQGDRQEEPKLSEAELASSATMKTPTLLYNQPSLVPCFWPSTVPYQNVFQLQYAFHPDVTGSCQFPMQHQDLPPSHQGQEIPIGNAGPGNALFILPVPWLLPVYSHNNVLNSHSDTNMGSKKTSSAHQSSSYSTSDVLFVKYNDQSSSNPSTRMEASNSSRTMPVFGPGGSEYTFQEDNGNDSTGQRLKHRIPVTESCFKPVGHPNPTRQVRAKEIINEPKNVSTPQQMSHSLLKENQDDTLVCQQNKSENVSAAAKARRRRKELIQMKNIRYNHFACRTATGVIEYLLRS